MRQPLAAPPVLNQTWALDFMTETLYDGRRVRLLTMIDEGNREGLEIAMGLSLPSRRVMRVLDELVAVHGCPSAVRVDNGPEFTAQTFVDWCAEHGVAIHYIQPGKPDQNAYIERFNRSYRTEVLNAHLFESVAELRALTDTWLRIYNSERPHDSLGRVPPLTFLAEAFISRSVSLCTVYLTGELTESRRVIIIRWACLSGTNPDQVATTDPTPGETGFRRRLQAPRTKPDVDWLRYARRRYDPFLDVRDYFWLQGIGIESVSSTTRRGEELGRESLRRCDEHHNPER